MWLMYGCKFINRILEMVGPGMVERERMRPPKVALLTLLLSLHAYFHLCLSDRIAEDQRMRQVLESLHQLEVILPTE